jgi:ketosteroid isomerase-like protein
MSESKEPHPLAATMEAYLREYVAGDEVAAAAFYSEDIEFFVQGDHHWAGEYRGKPAVTSLLKSLMHETCDEYELVALEDVLYSDAQVAVMPHWRLTLKGKTLDVKMITVYTFRDGDISRVRMYFEDPAAASKFYSLGR